MSSREDTRILRQIFDSSREEQNIFRLNRYLCNEASHFIMHGLDFGFFKRQLVRCKLRTRQNTVQTHA